MNSFFYFVGMAILETLRQPTYVVTTLLFPSMFFLFFGVPNARDPDSSALLTGSFACFGVLGVVLFQMTVGISQERSSFWNQYQRTWPLHPLTFLMSRLIAGLFLAGLTVALVVITSKMTTELEFHGTQYVWFFLTVILGGIPFASLGIFLGTLTTPRSAVPVANLFYLPLSFAGGLWIPPNALAEKVQELSKYLPTRSYGEIVWALVNHNPLEQKWIWIHLGYSMVFLALAVWSYRRDEGARFG